MSKTLSFVRLDFITIKPYCSLRNLALFAGMMFVMSLTDASGKTGVGLMMGIIALYVSYPFIVGEKSNIDILYATLSINRNTVVLGRYLFAFAFDLLGGACALAISFVISLITSQPFNIGEVLPIVLTMLVVFSILQAIQLPMYFKLGYTRAKFLVYMPLIILPLAVYFITQNFAAPDFIYRLDDFTNWLASNPVYTAVLVAAVWIMIILFSYGAALSAYRKRDL